MSPDERRYLIGQSSIGAAIVNAVFNAGLGWLFTRALTEFAIWKVPGVASDIAGTAFGVTFGTCIAMALQVPRDVAKNKIRLPDISAPLAARLARLPRNTFKRSLWLGLLSVPVFTPAVLLLLALSGKQALTPTAFVVLKGAFAAIEAALVTPFIVLGVLADLARGEPANRTITAKPVDASVSGEC